MIFDTYQLSFSFLVSNIELSLHHLPPNTIFSSYANLDVINKNTLWLQSNWYSPILSFRPSYTRDVVPRKTTSTTWADLRPLPLNLALNNNNKLNNSCLANFWGIKYYTGALPIHICNSDLFRRTRSCGFIPFEPFMNLQSPPPLSSRHWDSLPNPTRQVASVRNYIAIILLFDSIVSR